MSFFDCCSDHDTHSSSFSQGDPYGEGGSKISLTHLRSKFERAYPTRKWADVWSSIQRLIVKTLVMVEDDISRAVNCFEVFGFDVLLDAHCRPWLIEVNSSPSMGLETPLDRAIKPQMIRDTINLVNPLPFHRVLLGKLLERKLKEGSFEHIAAKSKEEKWRYMNEMLHFILLGRKPRVYGELPEQMGLYQRIAPGPEADFDNIMRMKRAAFQPSSTIEAKLKRSLASIV